MRTLLIVLSIFALVVPTPVVLAQPAEPSSVVVVPRACASGPGEPADDASRDSDSSPAVGLPAGLSFVTLGDLTVEEWPPRASGLILTLRHLVLDPEVASESRRAAGPIVFYVAEGSVGISINSQLSFFEPGAAVLVQAGQRYVLRNASMSPARVLRIQVVPPGEETQVAFGEPVQVHEVDLASPPGPPHIDSHLLMTAEIPAIEGRTHLTLGCLTWDEPSADSGDLVSLGPVGYVVLQGQMLVGEVGSRNPGDCVMFQAHVPHRLRSGESSPTVLVVAAMPDGAALWNTAAGSDSLQPASNRLRFACGEQDDATNSENAP